MISISGAFAVTWSIVFAYVADITEEENRSSAYGLVGSKIIKSNSKMLKAPCFIRFLLHLLQVW